MQFFQMVVLSACDMLQRRRHPVVPPSTGSVWQEGLRVAVFAAALAYPVNAPAMDTTAKAAMVLDATSGVVLLEKSAEAPIPPASMSKLMTLYVLFEAIRDQRVSLDTMFQVSERASKMGGSKMFLRQGVDVSVGDLIRGIVVQSGNDACIVVAENLAGTEESFAQHMNARARKIGLKDSTFSNSTGWPHPLHRMSVRDLVVLAGRIIEDFPEYYGFFSERSFTWDGISQPNRNPLLGLDVGVDGLKTGHTSEAGYGLVGSAKQGNRRIIFVVSGMESEAERKREALRLINWAFREFSLFRIFERDRRVAHADVWLGDSRSVGLVSERDILTLVPVPHGRDDMAVNLRYRGPVEAPVRKGDIIAEVVVSAPGLASTSYSLVAEEDVERGGLYARLISVVRILQNKFLSLSFRDG